MHAARTTAELTISTLDLAKRSTDYKTSSQVSMGPHGVEIKITHFHPPVGSPSSFGGESQGAIYRGAGLINGRLSDLGPGLCDIVTSDNNPEPSSTHSSSARDKIMVSDSQLFFLNKK